MTRIDTGERLSELAYLKTDDIDYEQNLFRVMGKGQRERFVPFGRRVAKALMKYQMKCRPELMGADNSAAGPVLDHLALLSVWSVAAKAITELYFAG